MADATARINVDINTSAAATGLRQLQSQITAFNSTLTKSSAVQATAMRNSTQNMLELVNASRFFTAETVRMQTAAASLDKTLSKGQVTIGQFFGARFRKDSLAAAQVMSLANARASALQTQFIATGAAANGMRDAIAIRPLQAFNDAAVVSAQKLAIHRAMLNQATTSMINFGKNTQWAGRQLMVGFTVPLTIFGGVAGKTFRELEREAVNFRKVYGDAFTPPEEMEQNLQAVQELAKEYTKYGIAVKDTIGLAAEAAAAGAQNQDLLDATTQSTRLATLGQMEQNQALETTISLQNAFKLSGDELAKSINFLNMVENQTVVTLQDLSAAIPRVAPVIKGLGGSVEDLAAFMAALQEGGVTAEQGANALKSGLASLINPTDRAKEKLDSLGISLDSIIEMNRGDLMGTVQDFAAALDTLDEFTRQQALEQVFGKFQYARLGALFANINKDGTQASRVLDMVGMSAAEMAASAEKELSAIEESVGTKFTAAMEQLKLAIAPIGELFTKMAIPVVNFFAKVIEKFNELPDFAKNFLGLATVIIGIVIPAGTMFLGLLMNLIGTLIKFGAIVGAAFKGFLSGGIKGAIDAVTQATGYMNLAEIDAANSAQQLAISAEAVNAAFLEQVTASDGAQSAVMELAYAYEILTNQMLEAAVANELAFGVGAAAMGQAGETRGPRIRRNRGGKIPGSGNTDTVPAMLTPGEFVVNKQATQDNLGLLKAINKGAMIPGFNIGGFLAATAAAVKSRSLTRKQVVEDYGIPLSTLKKHSLNLGIPKDSRGQYIYDVETIPLILRQVKNPYQKTHTSPFRSMTTLSSQIPGTSNRAQVAKMLADAGIPIELLDDAWLKLPFNQALRGNGISGKDLIKELKAAIKDQGSSFWGPAWSNVNKKEFIKNLEENIIPSAIYTDYGARGGQNFGSILWKSAAQSGGLDRKTVGAYVPKVQELKDSIDTLNNFYPDKTFRVERGADGYQYLEVVDKVTGKQLYREMARGSYGFNKGNIVPGQGNKDTVPAMLTPGEFIVNKEATQKNRALLEAINKGKIKGYELGGIVETLPGQYLVEGRDGRTFGPMPYDQAVSRSKQLVSRRARRSIVGRQGPRVPRRGMMAGASMLGMGAMMGGMMIPGVAQNPTASTAMFAGGMALQTLPMLGGLGGAAGALAPLAALAAPVAAIGAALAVAGVAAYKWRDSVDSAARKAAEFGANLGGTANAFNQIASLMGTTTPAQRQAALQVGFTAEEQQVISDQFQSIFGTEQGQEFIKELEEATSEERFKKLSDYLKAGIAAGIMDKEMAKGLAKAISITIGDTILGARTVGAIGSQETGAAAVADIAQARADSVKSLSEFTRVVEEEGRILDQADAAKIISGSIQTIQDFSNASALAREQLVIGEISQEEYNKIISQSESQQALFTKAIEESLMHTTDFGGTMQGVLDQLTKAGLATEEGLNKLKEAAEAAAFSNVVGQVGTQQNLMATGVSAIAAGMSEATVTEAITAIGGSERLQSTFENISERAGASQALGGSLFVNQILSGQMFGTTMQGRDLNVTARQAENFARRGGDIVGAQSYLLGQPLEQRRSVAQDFFKLSDEDKNTLVKDYQDLAQSAGDEFARNITGSDEYKKALEEETTEEFTKDIKNAAAIFGEETQTIIDHAERTGQSLSKFAEYGKTLQGLGEEALFRLGIDVTNVEDLEKFGPIADSIANNWPILQNLNPDINMSAYIDFLTVDENGNKLDAKETYENTKLLNQAWKAASNLEDIEARKTAIFQLKTLQNGVEMSLESFDSIWNGLIEEYGQKIIQKLPTSVLTKVIALELQIAASESSIAAAKQALSTGSLQGSDRAFANAIVAREGLNINRIRQEIDASVYGGSFGAGAGPGGGGGGGGKPEKTLAQELAAQAKASQKMFAGISGLMDTRGFKKFIAGPFAPEFLEYLRSQGEKGLKLIKGGLDKVKKAYSNFIADRSAQMAAEAAIAPMLRREEMDFMQKEINMRRQLASQGRSKEEINFIVENTMEKEKQIAANKKLIKETDNTTKAGRKRIENLRSHNQALRTDIKDVKANAKAYIELQKAMEFAGMSMRELDSLIYENSQTIKGLERRLEELASGGLVDLERQVSAQQKIADGINRTIELRQRDADAIGRAIELKQRELEPIDDAIQKYEEQIDRIEESYDIQLQALDDVAKAEENLARIREGRLDIASALSRGDVAGAAQAAVEMRRRFAEQQQDATRQALEARRQQEIDQVQGSIKQKQEERKVIEEEIERLQLSQRDIQDEIYSLQQSMIPVQDEIYRLNMLIADEADRLDDKYRDAAAEVRQLERDLAAARDRAIELANARREAAAAGGGGGSEQQISQPTPPSLSNAPSSVPAGTRPEMVPVVQSYIDRGIPSGEFSIFANATRRAFGGMISYKGSREPAPGMMYGGRVKKMAFGSLVPGRGMTDKVPAMLTPGEFVVRKPVVDQIKPMLQSLNSQVFPGMGMPRSRSMSVSTPQLDMMKRMSFDKVRYGIPQSINSFTYPTTNMNITQSNTDASPTSYNVGPTNVQYTYNLNIATDTNATPDDIANTVMYRIKRFDDRRIKGTEIG